jgi:hypothetical protein
MKSPKKNSRKNTRLSIAETENIPTIIFNKFSNEANIIVNELIEKIISLSISKNFNKKIENSIPSSCFDFLCNAVDSYLSLNFISYDKEEINDNNKIKEEKFNENNIEGIEPILNNNKLNIIEPNFEEQIFFNNYNRGENNWDLMDEPLSNKYDRYATTLVKFKEIDKEKNNKYNKEILEEIDEEYENITTNENKNNNNNKNINEIMIRNERKEGTKKITTRINNILNYDDNNNNNIKNKKRNLNEIMSQFSFHDLEDNNDIYKEPDNINIEKLRKEIQEKQNEQNEEKKNIKLAKKDVENKMKLAVEKNRQYAGKKITVDSNGEIIFIKGIKLDKLSKEFILMKTATKLVINEDKKDNDKSKSKKKKKKLNNLGININNNNNVINNNNEKEIKEKSNENNNNEKSEDGGDKNIKGKNQKLPKIRGNKFRKENTSEDLYKKNLLKRIEEGPIILSGSNFEIMNMEVGVSIKEKEKYKTGGKDFYHKFNKYSIDNYNKQLKDTLHINSFLKTQIETDNYAKNEINNYAGNLTDGYNSSINFTANNSNIIQQTINSNKNFISNYNTLSNFGNTSITKTKVVNSSLSPELKLSGIGVSLKGSMEKLSLISERQEKLAKKYKNIFKKKFFTSTSDKFTLPKLEEINKFSSEILTSSNWNEKKGVNNTFGKPLRYPEKPKYKEIIKDMDINGRIFRNRNKNMIKVHNTDINNKI